MNWSVAATDSVRIIVTHFDFSLQPLNLKFVLAKLTSSKKKKNKIIAEWKRGKDRKDGSSYNSSACGNLQSQIVVHYNIQLLETGTFAHMLRIILNQWSINS